MGLNFSDAIRAAGLEPPLHIEPGEMIRFPGIGKGAKNTAAWCKLFDDCLGGVFGDYSSGLYQVWQSRRTKSYTPEQRAEFMRQVEASRKAQAEERQAMQRQAAQKAVAIIKHAQIEPHAYLDGHGFRDAVGLVWYPDDGTNLLVIPMWVGDAVVGCQLIDRDGNKRFLKGQKTSGAEYVLGAHGVDWLVEGYATGLSLKVCLDAFKVKARVRVCFSAGNLVRIGKSLKNAFICCDHDVSETGEKAARETGHPYYLPYTKGDDLNDQWKRDGTFKTGMRLRTWMNSV